MGEAPEEGPYLLEETLKSWLNMNVVVAIGAEHLFTGTLKDFDEEVILLENVRDFTGNKGKALLIKISDINWIMLV